MLFSADERRVLDSLWSRPNQRHVFAAWPEANGDDGNRRKKAAAAQLLSLDRGYPGGIATYCDNARRLMNDALSGANPLEGVAAGPAAGARLDPGSPDHVRAEDRGRDLAALGRAAFVLVAGGLGERLGFSGAKLALPACQADVAEAAEANSPPRPRPFLGLYIASLLALEARRDDVARRTGEEPSPGPIPLAIMTSEDTHARTEALLAEWGNFGAAPGQIVLLKQARMEVVYHATTATARHLPAIRPKRPPFPSPVSSQGPVPCLRDAHGSLAPCREGPGCAQCGGLGLEAKPHGHGDVHALIHRAGLAERWASEGRSHVCFLQDTNAAAFRGLLPALGVAVERGMSFVSVCVPRRAGEAIGALARLERAQGGTSSSSALPLPVTLSVEYNLLDPVLRGDPDGRYPDGDTDDPATGQSPFPGSINELVAELGPYRRALSATGGVVGEFVNPKWAPADSSPPPRRLLKSARLECLMQDLPKALADPADRDRVGAVTLPDWIAFSPVKNGHEAASNLAREGKPTHSACQAESDWYEANRRLLALAGGSGVRLEGWDATAAAPTARRSFGGVPFAEGPLVSWPPDFALTTSELAARLPSGDDGGAVLVLGAGSALVVRGAGARGAVDSNLALGPCRVPEGAAAAVPAGATGGAVVPTIAAEGWRLTAVDPRGADDEWLRVRGFRLDLPGP